jgi:hypothetical protein
VKFPADPSWVWQKLGGTSLARIFKDPLPVSSFGVSRVSGGLVASPGLVLFVRIGCVQYAFQGCTDGSKLGETEMQVDKQ